LADEIGMTRFDPPQISQHPSAGGAEATRTSARYGPRPLPGIRGMSVRRVIGEDGMLDRSLPWPSGTVVDVSPAGGDDAYARTDGRGVRFEGLDRPGAQQS